MQIMPKNWKSGVFFFNKRDSIRMPSFINTNRSHIVLTWLNVGTSYYDHLNPKRQFRYLYSPKLIIKLYWDTDSEAV